MALEVIGGIASILQLAGTVYTISKTLYEVGEALSNAPSDIKDLARDLETFSDELHLLSTLLHGKDGRYADQVYRLTAKIIGDCATICTKIDRIIRKLRSGSVLAKIKWLYKEKEIMKLLARLRDLKLSLMGTLSVLSALRADNMMDSLGINNPSLIGGPNRHGLSTETRMQVEDTRLKLAGMSIKDTTEASSGSKPPLPSSASLISGGSSSTLRTSVTSATYVGPLATRIPSTTDFSASSFISMAVVPNSMPPILNTQANQSVDSFHSALSHQNQESLDGRMKQVESFPKPEDSNHVPVMPQSVMVSDRHDKASFSVEESRQLDTSVSKTLKSWRNEMTISAMRHFNMNVKDAEEWVNNLPIPSNLSAITEPTVPVEISPHLLVHNKHRKMEMPRKIARDRSVARSTSKGRKGLSYNSPPQRSPMFAEHIYMEGDRSGPSRLKLPLHMNTVFSDQITPFTPPTPSLNQNYDLLEFNEPSLNQDFDLFEFNPPSYSYKPDNGLETHYAQSERFSQYNPSYTTPIVLPHVNEKSTADQIRSSHEISQHHQTPQSPTQQAQPIQMQQQQLQKHQQQHQMTPLSPPRRLGVAERVTGVDFGRWHNVDACQSMEISATISSGLYELGTEDLSPKRESKEIHLQSQVSQETCKRDGQPSYPSNISPFGKSERRGRMELPPDYPNDISRQAFNSPKSDKSNNISAFHFHNEVSNKGPGGLWVRGFINVKSFDAVIWSNLKQYLNRERVYTTSEAGSVPLVANLDWSASLYKERIAQLRQMFPRAASSIQKILDVLAVMEETIGLTIGAIAWACLLGAVENWLSHSTNWTVDYQIRIITEMSEIVSIIARYTVMENIYAQWKGMTLDKDYEQSLINLSTRVLIYLGAFIPSFSESSTNANMKPYFEEIIEADTACRGFTVIVSSKSTAIDRKRSFEESSDDSDDTVDADGTILEVDGNDEVDDMPSSAKRIKI
ncbi:uncharacterized protein EAE98_006881 [Botrytis deweyae]|uniref:Fungal N-terminal domain-containing protein n=1 Tax=Botrytis deweyae TaxID=2478750 RepID=A0ABQ7IIZ3_9HELO|nr:uncharacterized protein EAE98_006881 [Botrytis deweyae]KAF7925656.1 hypothetical protein EAE98_006881 [Botrytis deweyae]